MAALDPWKDFRDDGGTPGWRSRATVIDVHPRENRFVAWFRRKSLPELLLNAFLLAFVLPWAILIGGLLLAYIFGRSSEGWR
jgi:hypothetical protein